MFLRSGLLCHSVHHSFTGLIVYDCEARVRFRLGSLRARTVIPLVVLSGDVKRRTSRSPYS